MEVEEEEEVGVEGRMGAHSSTRVLQVGVENQLYMYGRRVW